MSSCERETISSLLLTHTHTNKTPPEKQTPKALHPGYSQRQHLFVSTVSQVSCQHVLFPAALGVSGLPDESNDSPEDTRLVEGGQRRSAARRTSMVATGEPAARGGSEVHVTTLSNRPAFIYQVAYHLRNAERLVPYIWCQCQCRIVETKHGECH